MPWRALMPNKGEARGISSFTTNRCPLVLHARSDQVTLDRQLVELRAMFDYLGRPPDLLDLDLGIWPAPNLFDELRILFPGLRFMLHLSSMCQSLFNYDPERCLEHALHSYGRRLANHGGPITRIIWDTGGRTIIPPNPDPAKRFIRAVNTHYAGIEPVLKGGFGPDTLPLLDGICSETVEFSLEAEYRLAPNIGAAPDTQRTITYIERALSRLAPS